MRRTTSSSARKVVGLGFLPGEARHGFLIDIPNALRNWEALDPEERWWLYTMTVATTGQAMQKGLGWRKALRAAIADNPFVKGEGLSPKARRELLGHSQLSLSL